MDRKLECIDTPSLLVDLDILEANLRELAGVASAANVALRPHTKTHKSPFLAKLQLQYGASGITVAKIGEAEVMADAGITDIRIAYPIVGPPKLARLRRLIGRAEISLTVDSIEAARELSDLGEAVHESIRVLVKIDTGLNRVGVSPEEAVGFAQQVVSLPGLRLVGILTHEGHCLHEAAPEGVQRCAIQAGEVMVETANKLRGSGIPIQEVSVGSTSTARTIAFVPGVTEIRPGTYIFNDLNEIAAGVASEETCALSVLVTVVSIPTDNRAVIDAGSKTLSSDLLAHPLSGRNGHGYVKGHSDITIEWLNEEHGVLSLDNAKTQLKIGQRLQVIPNHVCTVVNLADFMYGMRHGEYKQLIEISGRGQNR